MVKEYVEIVTGYSIIAIENIVQDMIGERKFDSETLAGIWNRINDMNPDVKGVNWNETRTLEEGWL
jgi:hypothetical protein